MSGAPRRLLDWGHRSHWAPTPQRCRFCPGTTHLRDDYGRPAHKVCAEAHPRETATPPKTRRSR